MFDVENAEVSIDLSDANLGISPAKFHIPCARVEKWETVAQGIFKRLRYHAGLKIPHLPELEPHEGTCVIVGSAPSTMRHLEGIRVARKGPYDIVATLNGAHGLLVKNDIIPNIHLVFEIDIKDLGVIGGPPHKDVRYYVCSHCPEFAAEELKDHKMVLWHCFNEPPDYQGQIAKWFPGEFMVGGAHATLFRTVNIAIILGFRKFEIYGCDSSFGADESDHFENYPTPAREERITVWGYNPNGDKVKKFHTLGSLAFQAWQFIDFCNVNQSALRIRIHGDGLLRYVHESRYPEQYLNQGSNNEYSK